MLSKKVLRSRANGDSCHQNKPKTPPDSKTNYITAFFDSIGQTRTSSLGRTSASAECRHWSGRAVRWSSCAILLSKVQSVDQRMRLGMRCRLSPTADVPSHTSGAAMCQRATSTRSRSVRSGGRDRKLKESTLRFARDRPQPSAVGFDDRAADR